MLAKYHECELMLLANDYDHNTLEVKVRQSGVQGHLFILSEVEDKLFYMRFYLRKEKMLKVPVIVAMF